MISYKKIFIISVLCVPIFATLAFSAVISPTLIEMGKEAEGLFQKGFYVECELQCKKILEIDPNFFYPYYVLGKIYALREGQEEKSILYFSKAVALSPGQIDIYNSIAYLNNKLNRFDEAISILKQGLKLDPTNFEMNLNLGITYLVNKQQPYEAVEYLKAAESKKPAYDRVIYLVGVVYFLTNHEGLAVDYVTKLRKIKSDFLANQLEAIMRPKEEMKPATVDMAEVMKNYISQPKSGQQIITQDGKIMVMPQGIKPGKITIGPATTTGTGEGKITIKQEYRQKTAEDDKPSGETNKTIEKSNRPANSNEKDLEADEPASNIDTSDQDKPLVAN